MSNGNNSALSTKEFFKSKLNSLKKSGDAPSWMTWMGYQTLCGGYLLEDETPRGMYERIARACASYLPDNLRIEYEPKFFDVMWKGWVAPSTPICSNIGTSKGMAVSCSGNYVADDLSEIYMGLHENAMLTKYGFGTSSYLGHIRPRGSKIAGGGKSSGLTAWTNSYQSMSQDVTQGSARRGAIAMYFDIEHGDFYDEMEKALTSDKKNIGINISDEFISRLESGDEEALRRYQKLLETRMVTGRPYIFFVDRVNRLSPESYKKNNLRVHASNLCTEITLFSDRYHSFSCVLMSMNASRYDEWKNTDAVFIATIMLDCVAEDLIVRGKHLKGLEKVVRFTEKGRALGLGLLGFHTYLQKKMMPFDSLPAQYENDLIFSHMKEEANRASRYLASVLGEPEWCKGLGVRNTHLLAVAPNVSSALICESVSQSCEPQTANVVIQKTAKGKFKRINPVFLDLLKSKGKDSKEVLDSVAMNNGSCQHLDFLTADEKEVFKTSFEINQKAILKLAERRQKYIDQAQSINLFFSAEETPEWIHEVHKMAFKSEWIKSLYYVRTQAGIRADKGGECLSCHA